MCDDADIMADMLFITLQRRSNAVDVRSGYIISEHDMLRYEAAVAAYVGTNATPKTWGEMSPETRSMYELGVAMALNDQSDEMTKILRCDHAGNCVCC